MEIKITGDYLGATGYASHTRNLAQALKKEGVDIKVETNLIPGWENMVSAEDLELFKLDGEERTEIMISTPPSWETRMYQGHNFIGVGVFEGDTVPLQWKRIAESDSIKQLWVPSNHVKDAFINTGLDGKKIKIVPHGVDTELFNKDVVAKPDLKTVKNEGSFVFLFVGGWAQGENDRKNLPLLLRAYTEEFGKDEKVQLIVKINPVYNRPQWRPDEEIEKLNLKNKWSRASFSVVSAILPYERLPEVYSLADCQVQPTRGEGFCLPILEGMSCGVPCIATAFGGQEDFMNDNNGWLLKDFELKQACEPNLLYEGINWAELDQKALQKAMRYAFEHQDEVRTKGKQAAKDANEWTWQNSAKKAIEYLKEVK